MLYDAPEEVRRLPRRKRIAWWRNKVEREEAAISFITSLDTGLDEDELKSELTSVRQEIEVIESALKMFGSGSFDDLSRQLKEQIVLIKQCMSEQGTIVVRQIMKRTRRNDDLRLADLKRQEAEHRGIAEQLENQLKVLCTEAGASPTPFLRLHTLKEYSR